MEVSKQYVLEYNHLYKCGSAHYVKYKGLLICAFCGDTLLSFSSSSNNCAAEEARKDNGAGSAGVVA